MINQENVTEAQAIRPELKKLIEQLKSLSRSELLDIYKIYSQKMINSDDITWKTASIFIPLSLTGIVFGLKDPQNIFSIGAFSVILIWLWSLIAYRNSGYYRIYYRIITAIESVLINQESSRFVKGLEKPVPRKHRKIRHRRIILLICLVVTIAWGMAIIVSSLKIL